MQKPLPIALRIQFTNDLSLVRINIGIGTVQITPMLDARGGCMTVVSKMNSIAHLVYPEKLTLDWQMCTGT